MSSFTTRYRPSLGVGALLGAVTLLAVAALGALGHQSVGLPDIARDAHRWLAGLLPAAASGALSEGVADAAAALGGSRASAAEATGAALSGLLALLIGAAAGVIIAGFERRERRPAAVGLILGLLLAAGSIAISASFGLGRLPILSVLWIVALLSGWGTILGAGLGAVGERTLISPASGRRQVVGTFLRALIVAAAAFLAARLFSPPPS